jgi:hypothetical protein
VALEMDGSTWDVQFDAEGAAAEQLHETLCNATADGGYTGEKLHICHETALYYKLLTNKSLDSKIPLNKASMKSNKA